MIPQNTLVFATFTASDESERVTTNMPALGWFNVISFGHPLRATQIAIQAYGDFYMSKGGDTYTRYKHDTGWGEWVKLN